VGIDLHVDRVPLREADMEPFEIMVSESQERMLCVVEPDRVDAVIALTDMWEVHGTVVGEVTDTGHMRIYDGGELVGDMPVAALVDDCPIYDLAPAPPAEPLYAAPPATLSAGASTRVTLLELIASPNIASRRPLFEQYDAIVQSRTVRRPEECDAAVLALPGGAALAASIDGNGRRVAADPYWGTVSVVLECASNLACAGAKALGTTNNLNFGNPEKPHIAWQLTEAVRGIGDACRALQAPIIGGNVSLYNEGASGPIYPTPVIGMVGRMPDVERAGRLAFAQEGDAVAIAGHFTPSLAASELAKLRGEALPDGLPAFDIDQVIAAQEAIREAVREGLLSSAHDIAEGGFLVAVAESCLAGGIGATLDLGPAEDPWTHLFGEGPGGFVVSGHPTAIAQLAERIPLDVFGAVGGDTLHVAIAGEELSVPLGELREAHDGLRRFFP
jgi:phosphoribosylformylglycinamidine synthase subunit PurL